MMVRDNCFSSDPYSGCAASCFYSCFFDMNECFRFGMSLLRVVYPFSVLEEGASPSCPGPQTVATFWHPRRLPCSGWRTAASLSFLCFRLTEAHFKQKYQ
ncbi:hypothetical protein AMECASPLE_033428 [Ameca splendens]|uniref:Uncharacterized protein n=1 Tax=Ameca splendens TaxID=208324 RepID=A0ABV0XJU9_9TELE